MNIISKKTSITAILIATSLILASSNSLELAFAEKEVSKIVIKKCEKLYGIYKKLGKTKFYDAYSKKSYFKDCLKLYNDSTWTFKGKSQIDNAYKITELDKATYETTKKGSVKAISKQKIGSNKYIVEFSICAVKNQINDPRIFIKSDREHLVGISKIPIPSQTCRTVSSQVIAYNPNSLQTILLNENVYVPTKIKTIQIK